MVKLLVLYGRPQDEAEFTAYYNATHVPLVDKMPGLKRFEHGRTLAAADGGEAPYWYFAELGFDDADAMQASRASPEGTATAADVGNFATGGVTLFTAEA